MPVSTRGAWPRAGSTALRSAPVRTPGARRRLALKAALVFAAALAAGAAAAAFVPDAEETPAPRVQRTPSDDRVLYEDQYVRVLADPAPARTPSTETQP